ncbi:hypothetical protein H7E67_13830 [Clostridium gasigenes]|uniref:hypothetical protein n=1 Tax=Clostridium gasigenes TaxID=94869 RepID=UPI0016279061|nr:hypothetical protein [Clostridium gasigenes]MBB6624515.1 hypothetical protein [Clostridium gasigenes]
MDNQKALKAIRNAWELAIVSILMTLIAIMVSVFGKNNFLGLDLYGLVDVVLVMGLAFGIYKKSRVCAVILFIYFIVGRIDMMISYGGKPASNAASIFFAFGYFQGIRGTIHYHKNKKKEKQKNREIENNEEIAVY